MNADELWAALAALSLPTGEHDDAALDLPRLGPMGAAFSDDLICATGRRLAVRVRITDRPDGGYVFDLRDADRANEDRPRFRLSAERTRAAVALALGRAVGRPADTLSRTSAFEVLTEPDSWVHCTETDHPAVVAFGMARVFDAVTGALANAWPQRVGAGSCSLGAIVEITTDDGPQFEVLPGGEGADAHRVGRSGWDGPIVQSGELLDHGPWFTASVGMRTDSGGGGARDGGDGIVRTYLATKAGSPMPMTIMVAIDRTTNPPHGIDRAGPPVGSSIRIERPDGEPREVAPWCPIDLAPGERLVIETCGGAGHGFPGYGDIAWDPSEWFGAG